MNKHIRVLSLILCALMLLGGCKRGNNTETSSDSTDNATDTKPVSDVRDTADNSTSDGNDTTVYTAPNDGKVHVESISLDKYSVSVSIGSKDMPWVTMMPENADDKSEIWESDNTAVATVDKYGNITGISEGTCTVTVTSADNKTVSAKVNVEVKAAAGLTYMQGVLIVNKSYSLPASYNPGVDATANAALDEMIASAKNDGISLWIASGFRSYERQKTLYNNYVARDGKAAADRYSARPGYSEHQTGLAFDLNSLEQSFGETKEGKWLAANCWKYGFIIRYPKNKEAVTGYMYEPWHVRYLGKDMAQKVYDSGLCLEEYLNITSVYAD